MRDPNIRRTQAKLAKQYGIDGFLYWHYWFGNGKCILERPFNDAIKDKKYNTQFALAWANESWIKYDKHCHAEILIKQTYPSETDHIQHFYSLLHAFKDKRYIKIDGKPIFIIYRPSNFPNLASFIELWNRLAIDNDLPGIYFIAHHVSKSFFNNESYDMSFKKMLNIGFNSVNYMRLKGFIENRSRLIKLYFNIKRKILYKIFHKPLIYKYSKASHFFIDPIDRNVNVIPTIISGWDNTPRYPWGIILKDYAPHTFQNHVEQVFSMVRKKPHPIIFLKSWNEWAEGNYIEPDLKWGHSFLQIIKENIKN